MKRSKLIFIIILVIYFLPLILTWFEEAEINLNPFDYARITDIDYTAVVADNPGDGGKIFVTERLTYDIHAASKNNPFWELWRDLPEDTVDGLKVEYKVNSVKQILDDGTEIAYEESPKLYWNDSDYLSSSTLYGPGKWYHSEGPYNEDKRQYECLLLYVDGLYREKVTFEIEYEMSNASLYYNDCSELYISLYSGNTIKYLNSYDGQILFPNSIMPKEGNYEVHTYGTNNYDFPYTESDTLNPGYHTFSFKLDKNNLKFIPYTNYLEFALISFGEYKHSFTKYAPENYYSGDNVLSELRDDNTSFEETKEKSKQYQIYLLIGAIITSIFITIYTINTNKRMSKKHKFYKPTTKIKFFREIPSDLDPNFVANLLFSKSNRTNYNKDGYSATILSLVRKKYIKLEKIEDYLDWNFNNVKIVILKKPEPIQQLNLLENDLINKNNNIDKSLTLTPTEEHYFNLICKYSSYGIELPMEILQRKVASDYENTETFINNINSSITNIGVTEGYFQKSDYTEAKTSIQHLSKTYRNLGILSIILCNLISYYFTFLGISYGAFFILGFVFLINSLYLRKISGKYVLLTQFGEDEYEKWRGLYNFLNSETLMKERTIIELPLWEQYLVYATAFGISEKVIKALKIRCPDVTSSDMLSNPYYSSRSFYRSSHSFRYATHSAIRTAHSSSYGGGYGGFSGHGYGGGGRGGGGGRRGSLTHIIIIK